MYAQLVGPTSDWNTVIQSDVYGDAIFEPDANKQDLFGNSSYPVLQSAYNGSNFYFKVLLNGSTTDLNKDLKFFLGIDADQDNDIDFFIKFKRKKNGYGHELKFFNTDSGSQSGPSSTSWDGSKNNYFKSSNSDDLYSSNSDIGSDLSGSGNDDHFYIFGFPISLLQTFIASDFPAFNSSTTVNLIAFSAEGGDKDLDGADRKDILGIDDTTIQNGNGYNSSYSWSSLFVTNSFDGFSGNGDNTAPNLTQVTAITTPSNDTTPSYVFTTDEAGTISTSISQGFSTSSSGLTGSNQTIIFNTLPEGTYSGETITVTDTAGNAGSITIPDFVIDTTAPTLNAIETTAFSWGSVLNATEDNSDGTVSVTTSGAEDGQTLTITLNGATYTNTVSSNSVTVTISAAGLQALTNGSSYTLTADVSDTAGNAATQVTSSSFSVETTTPTISGVLLAADNSTLTVTMSEAVYNTNGGSGSIEISDFALSISGGVASINTTPSTISSSGNEYTLGLTISGTPNGSETLTVVPSSSSAIYDLAGNAASTTQSNNTVSLNDTSPPTLSNVSIVSNNTTNTLAKAGDEITLTFTASETINEPVVTFQSGSSSITDSSVTYTNTSGNTWTAKYTANASDTDGSVSFSIAFTDGSNAGTDVTTGSGSVIFDNTLPTVSSFTTTTSSGSYNQAEEIVITANTTESVQSGNTITVTLDTSDTVLLTAASTGTTLVGTYTVGAGDTSAGLTVSSFAIGTVADTAGNAMTSTTLPVSRINFWKQDYYNRYSCTKFNSGYSDYHPIK